ncbi:hypothetical protein [Lysobacter hankyongensis]|uniref:Uncharacterized protein n=1 Tax=Lysobacter hankyongensis TaxID=1176535 RepID=A0ABP9BI62_9GAMM
MKRILPALLLWALCPAATLRAHDLIPESWCYGGSRQTLLEVHFWPDELRTYKSTHLYIDPITQQPCPPTVKCGIVDDWHWATQIMNEGIPAFASQRRAGPRSATASVIAVSTTPDYNDRASHHSIYSFDDGLTVRYLGCEFTNNSPQ